MSLFLLPTLKNLRPVKDEGLIFVVPPSFAADLTIDDLEAPANGGDPEKT
jgi:hypothetical protein